MKFWGSIIILCCITAGAAFAGGQNESQEHQTAAVPSDYEVSNKYPFTLSVYGNADMNDSLDENDIEYLKKIINGTLEETQFADANYDGGIDGADIAHIESLLAEEETEVTMTDSRDRVITIKTPLQRVVSGFPGAVTFAAHMRAVDRIIGVDQNTVKNADSQFFGHAYPEIKDCPIVGTFSEINQEMIITLKPDIIFAASWGYDEDVAKEMQKNTGTAVYYLGHQTKKSWTEGGYFEIWRKMGILYGKQKLAEELIAYWSDETEKVTKITSEITEEDRVKVYICGFTKAGILGTQCGYDPIDIGGGKNVADKVLPTTNFGVAAVPKEQIIQWNPDVILIHRASSKPWHTIEDILSDPTFQTINAIKNQDVYHIRVGWQGSEPAGQLTECFYLAKLFYPEKFSDLNVESEGNAILKKYFGVNGLYTWTQSHCGLYSWK